MPVNYGILQYPSTPGISTQVIERPNYAAQNEQGLLQGLQAADQAQRTQIENQVAQSNIAKNQQEMDFAKQMQPGALQGQQLQNQGQGLLNQKNQLELKQAQFKDQAYHNEMGVYAKTLQQTGDKNVALQAMISEKAKTDPSAAIDLSTNFAKMRDSQIDDYKKQLSVIAEVSHQALSQKDPIAYYQSQKPFLKKMAPDMYQTLDTKDPNQFNQLAVGAMSIDYPYKEQQMIEAKALESNKVSQATVMQSKAQAEMDRVLHDPNATAEEKQRAADGLENAKAATQSAIHGEGIGGQLFYDVKKGWDNGTLPTSVGGAINSIQQKISPTPMSPGVVQAVQNAQNQQSSGQQPQVPQITNPAPVQIPKEVLSSPTTFQAWYSKLPPEVQKDMQINPQKYGLTP